MFRIFRKVRLHLINPGKASKYSLYALGEIFLVVIGILIALQINIWNEERKDKITSVEYLRELRTDAASNIENLENAINSASDYVRKVEDGFLSKVNIPGHEITKEELDKLGIIRQTFFINDDTYQEIISSGQLSLIPKEVKSSLMKINTLFKQANRIDGNAASQFNSQQLKMAEFYELRRLGKSNSYKVIYNASQNKEQALLTYKNYINLCYDWMKTQIRFYTMLKDRNLDLIQNIDKSELLR